MNNFDDMVNKAQTLSDILSTPQTISFGDLCQIYSEYLCIDSLSNIEITLPSIAKVPASLQKFISNISKITFSSSVSAVFIVPISFAFLFCIVQLFPGSKGCISAPLEIRENNDPHYCTCKLSEFFFCCTTIHDTQRMLGDPACNCKCICTYTRLQIFEFKFLKSLSV